MPTVYVKLWNQYDQEVIWPLEYGKKRTKPQPLKAPWWRKAAATAAAVMSVVKEGAK